MAKVYTEEVDIERVKVDIKSGEVDIESTKVDIRNKLLSFSDTISEKTINHTVEIFSKCGKENCFGRTAVTLVVCVSDLLDKALHVCIQLADLILHGQDDCHECFPAETIQFFFCIYFCHGCPSPLSDVFIVTQR